MVSLRGQHFKIGFLAEGATRMSCQNADCEQSRKGWVTVLDPGNARHAAALVELQARGAWRFHQLCSDDAADWVTNHAAAQGYTDHTGALMAVIGRTPPGMLMLVFPAGQPCLRGHADREVIFTHETARGVRRVHTRPVDFNEHVNQEADRIEVLRERELPRG